MPIEVCLFPQTVHTLPLEETPLEIQKHVFGAIRETPAHAGCTAGSKERGKGMDDKGPNHFKIKANVLESIVPGQ